MDLDIDPTGYVAGIPDSQFSTVTQLGEVMAKSAQCQECVVKQYFRYTTGRMDTPADGPAIHKLLEDFRNSQFHFKELIVSLARLREFPNTEGTVYGTNEHQPR